MLFCRSCGESLPLSHLFCRSCGESLQLGRSNPCCNICCLNWEPDTRQGTRKRGREQDQHDLEPAGRQRRFCPQQERAKEFLRTLGLNSAFFDPSFDRCYCSTCAEHLPATLRVAAEHTYELPFGFVGFGMKVPPRADALKIFDNWAVSYHCLKATNVASVLNEGGLLLPGDTLLDGTTLGAAHTRDKHRHRLYTSPSVLYSEKPVYTEPSRFCGDRAKIVLQCRQRPDFEVCGETIGWERKHPNKPITPHFPNSAIEWFTTRRNSVIPYRLLIKLEEPFCIVKWASLVDKKRAHVQKNQITKCRPSAFWQAGDVVKATQTFHEGDHTIRECSLGTLKTTLGAVVTICWHGRIGEVSTQRNTAFASASSMSS